MENEQEWIEWNGGECPVSPDALVDVRKRIGSLYFGVRAGDLADQDRDLCAWHHDADPGDIIAYRTLPMPTNLEEAQGVHTPWYVLDQRATTLRAQGWTGPKQDAILISNKSPQEVLECRGDNCIIARISFDNRDEELGESNMADAVRIVTAVNSHDALLAALKEMLSIAAVWAVLDHGKNIDLDASESVIAARAAIQLAEGR